MPSLGLGMDHPDCKSMRKAMMAVCADRRTFPRQFRGSLQHSATEVNTIRHLRIVYSCVLSTSRLAQMRKRRGACWASIPLSAPNRNSGHSTRSEKPVAREPVSA